VGVKQVLRFAFRELPNFSIMLYWLYLGICFGCAAGSIALIEAFSANNHAAWWLRLAFAVTAFLAAFILVRLYLKSEGYQLISVEKFRVEYRKQFLRTSWLQRLVGLFPLGLLACMMASDLVEGGPIWSLQKLHLISALVILFPYVLSSPNARN